MAAVPLQLAAVAGRASQERSAARVTNDTNDDDTIGATCPRSNRVSQTLLPAMRRSRAGGRAQRAGDHRDRRFGR